MRSVKWLVVILLLFTLVPGISAQAATPKNIVVIDPGHGGQYGGTAGFSGNSTGYYEKHANLEVSNRLKAELERRGYEVFMTRTGDTHFASPNSEDLKARTKKSNDYVAGKNDRAIFISVHHNATSSPSYRGYETYYFDIDRGINPSYPPDPLQVKYSPDSKRLAHAVHGNVLANAPIPEGRGIVHEEFFVTRNAQVPSILLEVGYMSNPTEERLIKQPGFQSQVAVGVANGVDQFFNTYSVYDHNNVLVRTFTTETEAVNFAKARSNMRVVFDRTQKEVFNNISLHFAVYHSSNESFKHYFPTENAAIDLAKKWKNTRVVNNSNGHVLWSNYLPADYEVWHASQGLMKKFFNEAAAINYAKANNNTRVFKKSKGYVIWSNYMNKNHQVTHTVKGNLIAFYSRNEAIDYAKKFRNTKVINKVNNNVEFDNTTPSYQYSFKTNEVAAQTRLLTAIEVSKRLYPQGFASGSAHKKVVLATAFDYADALSAGPLAAKYSNAPILLTRADDISVEVKNEIKRLKATEVVIAGGTLAVSDKVVRDLQSSGLKVTRISGASRFDTNAKINAELGAVSQSMVVSGLDYPDALSASSIAVNQNASIVLVDRKKMDARTLGYLNNKKATIVGGTLAVTQEQEDQLKNYIGTDRVIRLSGKTRFDTNVAVMKHFNKVIAPKLIVTTGMNFPDALASSSLSKAYGAPLLLTSNSMNAELDNYTRELGNSAVIEQVEVVGGAVEPAVLKQITENLK